MTRRRIRSRKSVDILGTVGDILWVREEWVKHHGTYFYKSSDEGAFGEGIIWNSSCSMPIDACRMFLEITSVRCEFLQQISRGDIYKEGYPGEKVRWWQLFNNKPEKWFEKLWVSLFGEDGWKEDPQVLVIEYKHLRPYDIPKYRALARKQIQQQQN